MPLDINKLRSGVCDGSDAELATSLAKKTHLRTPAERSAFSFGILLLLQGFDPEFGGTGPDAYIDPARVEVTAEIIGRIAERNSIVVQALEGVEVD